MSRVVGSENSSENAHGPTWKRSCVWVFLALLGITPVLSEESQGIERTRDEILANYYLWDYYLLEGSSMLRDYSRTYFDGPAPEFGIGGPRNGIRVGYRFEMADQELTVSNIGIGPLILGGSVYTRSMFSLNAGREFGSGPTTWVAEDGTELNSFLGPMVGWSGSAELFRFVKVSYRYIERSFYNARGIPEGAGVSEYAEYGTELPPTVATETGQSLKVSVYPETIFSDIPVLSAIPAMSYAIIAEDLEPRGYVTTVLIQPPFLLSKFFVQGGQSDITGIRFAKATTYLLADTFLGEIEYDTYRQDELFHEDWRFRRGRVGLNIANLGMMLGSGWSDTAIAWSDWATTYRIAAEYNAPFVIGIFGTYEWRSIRPELVPGVPALIEEQGPGAAYQIMARLGSFDTLLEGNAFFPWEGFGKFVDPFTGVLPTVTFSLELRWNFREIGANR